MAFMSSAQPAFGAVNSGFSFGSAVSETKSAPKTEITNKPQIPPLGKITVIQTSSQIIIRSCAVYFRTIFFLFPNRLFNLAGKAVEKYGLE